MSVTHGVVVIHGQGADRERGTFLAEVSSAIADTLESQQASVSRSFGRTSHLPEVMLTVTAKAGDGVRDVPDYTLVGAYWDDAFPPPAAETVYRWAFPHVLRQVTQTFCLIFDSTNDWRGGPRGNQTRPKLGFWTRLSFQIHSVVLWVLLLVAVILSLPILAILFILTVLSKTPGLRLFGLWALVIRAIHTLDPFVTEIMGDSQRYVDDGVWAASARGVIEMATIDLLNRPGINDVTLAAHSAGCGVAYDALLEGGVVGKLLSRGASQKAVRLVTLGSAINRYYWISSRAKKAGGSPVARRFVDRHLDPSVVRPSSEPKLFSWLDLHARFDFVSSGGLDPGLVPPELESHVTSRQVVNRDNPFEDHFGYFENRSLVMPRIIWAINGDEDPLRPVTGPVPGYEAPASSWTSALAPRRLRRLAAQHFVRLVVGGAMAAHLVLLRLWDGWRTGTEDFLGWLNDGVTWALDRLPFLAGQWEGDLEITVGRILAIFGPLILLLAMERVLSASFFHDPDGPYPQATNPSPK